MSCVTCGHPDLPGRHTGQPAWHPSGRWLVVQAEKRRHAKVRFEFVSEQNIDLVISGPTSFLTGFPPFDLEVPLVFDYLDCGDWEAQSKCPEREAKEYEKYAKEHPQSPKTQEALYQAALDSDLSSWPCYRGRLLLNYGRWLRRQRRVAESRAPLRRRDARPGVG